MNARRAKTTLSDNSVHPVSASDCIEYEGFENKNFMLIENITSGDKEQCKQECLKVNFVSMGGAQAREGDNHTDTKCTCTLHLHTCRKIQNV